MYFLNLNHQFRRILKAGLFLGLTLIVFLAVSCAGSKKKTVEETPLPEIIEQPEPPEEKTPEPQEKPAVEMAKPEKIPMEFRTVYFDFDKSEIRSDAVRTLQQNAKVMKEYPDVRITIEGHCDERGTVEYNLALGDRRAIAVKQYLVDLGVSPSRISTISYGKEQPVDPRRTEEAYAKNRRAEFVVR